MNVFKDYAAYYDLLYKNKKYEEEAEYIHKLIQRVSPGAKTILNLGCGTGNHDFYLIQKGYNITAVDISQEMIDIAVNKTPKSDYDKIKFIKEDIRSFNLEQKFDVILSLFHVISYQVTNEDIQSTFQTVKNHLNPQGKFIFDCWYGPGVLSELPSIRYKMLESKEYKIHRISNPSVDLNKNEVSIDYTVLVKNKIDNNFYEFNELHKLRYYFTPEVDLLCSFFNFSSQTKYLSYPNIFCETNWYRLFVLENLI